MKSYNGFRVPVIGETWVYMRCKRHATHTDAVQIGRSFEDQNEFFQRDILSRIKHGCFRPIEAALMAWDVEASA